MQPHHPMNTPGECNGRANRVHAPLNDVLVVFSHGKESGPTGSKILALAAITAQFQLFLQP